MVFRANGTGVLNLHGQYVCKFREKLVNSAKKMPEFRLKNAQILDEKMCAKIVRKTLPQISSNNSASVLSYFSSFTSNDTPPDLLIM